MAADTIRTFRVELTAEGLASFQKVFGSGAKVVEDVGKRAKVTASQLDALQGQALRMNDTWRTAGSRASAFADNMGKVSTTLARSADSFGLPAGPLRALDDVMDVAELGFNGLTKSAVGFNAASIGVAGAGAAIGVAIGTLLRQIPAVEKAADAAAKAVWSIFDPPTQGGESQADFAARMSKVNDQVLKGYVERLRKMGKTEREIAAALGGGEAPPPAVGQEAAKARLGLDDKTLDAKEKAREKAKRIADKALEDQKRAAEKYQELKDSLSGAKAQAEVDELTKAFKELGVSGVADLDALLSKLEALEKQGAKITDKGLLGAMRARRIVLPEMVDPNSDLGDLGDLPGQITASMLPAQSAFNDMAATMARAGLSTEEISDSLESAGASAGQIQVALSRVPTTFADRLRTAFGNLPNVILGAIQGGGNVGQSIGAALAGDLTKGLGEKAGTALGPVFGKTLGAGLGSIIPGLGTMLGAGLGSFAGKIFGKLFGSEAKKVNDLRDAFLEGQGGFVELQKKLQGLSNQDLVRKIFDAKTVQGFNAAVKEVTDLLGLTTEAENAAQEAADRWNLTTAERGPVMALQELEASAKSLYKDWTLLEAKQADMTALAAKMAPDVSRYVQEMRAAGQAIPENMKPIIDAVAKHGLLLDENGKAWTEAEASGISYTESLSASMQDLVGWVEKLVKALLGIPQDISTDVTVRRFDEGMAEGVRGRLPSVEDLPSFARGTGGFRDFGAGTVAMLHGLEAVVPKGSEGAMGAGDTINITAPINENPLQTAEGLRQMRTHTIRELRRELGRSLGARVAMGTA